VDNRADVERRDVNATMGTTIVSTRRRVRYRVGVAAAISATFVLLAASTAWAATGGYGPGGPGSPPPPGGYSNVVAARTIGPKGTHMVVQVAGAVAVIDVAPKAFSRSVILKITRPDLGQITSSANSLGVPNTKAVAGIGVDLLLPNGTAAPTPFAKPVAVTLYGAFLGAAGERVVNLTGPTTTVPITATIGLFHVGFSVTGDVDVAVLNSVKKPHGGAGKSGVAGGSGAKDQQTFGVLDPAAEPALSIPPGASVATAPAPQSGGAVGPDPSNPDHGDGATDSLPPAASWMTGTPAAGTGTAGGSRQAAINSVVTTSNASVEGGAPLHLTAPQNVRLRLAVGAVAILIGLVLVALYAAKRGPGAVRS